jgi:hypothetical protein
LRLEDLAAAGKAQELVGRRGGVVCRVEQQRQIARCVELGELFELAQAVGEVVGLAVGDAVLGRLHRLAVGDAVRRGLHRTTLKLNKCASLTRGDDDGPS